MYGEEVLVFQLLTIGMWIACAIIAGNIANKKGRSPVAFGLLGFFLGIIGVIIAAVVEDRSYNYQQPNTWNGNYPPMYPYPHPPMAGVPQQPQPRFPKPSKKVYVRNCFVNSPLRPYQASLLLDGNTLIHTVYVLMYDNSKPGSILVRIEAFDVFERPLYQVEKSAGSFLYKDKGFSFKLAVQNEVQADLDTIYYLEVYILSYAIGTDIQNIENLQKCTAPIQLNQLAECKKTYGPDAIAPLVEHENSWNCVCGNVNTEDQCPVCHRSLTNMKDSSHVVKLFIASMNELHHPKDIQDKFQELKGVIHQEKWEQANRILEKAVYAKRIYNTDMDSNQKTEVAQLLRE